MPTPCATPRTWCCTSVVLWCTRDALGGQRWRRWWVVDGWGGQWLRSAGRVPAATLLLFLLHPRVWLGDRAGSRGGAARSPAAALSLAQHARQECLYFAAGPALTTVHGVHMHSHPGRRRRPQQQAPFAGLQGGDGAEGLLVFGLAAQLHRDDALVQQLDRGDGLLECWGEPTNLVDRWDVRWARGAAARAHGRALNAPAPAGCCWRAPRRCWSDDPPSAHGAAAAGGLARSTTRARRARRRRCTASATAI